MNHHLVIDAGNTLMKFAYFSGDLLKETFTWDKSSEADLHFFLSGKSCDKILLSDVSGQALAILKPFFLNTKIQTLGSNLKLPFKNLYATPNTLGADRMALVAGAVAKFPAENCLVIDAGTCVTYDLLTNNLEYLGGNITPGLIMRLKAMHTFTGKLPKTDFVFPESVLGQSTNDCLISGAYHGLVGEIAWLAHHYGTEYPNLKVLLTGGDAQLLAKRLKTNIFAEPQLLLHGLNKIASIND
jgi:type III pantothenate kinase